MPDTSAEQLSQAAGLDWPGLDWPGLDWPGLDWPGLDWPGLDWRHIRSFGRNRAG